MELLEVAKASVPPSVWTVTPAVLRATAGLRLLPGEKAKHLLDQVRSSGPKHTCAQQLLKH